MLFQAGESEDRFGSQDAAVAHLEQAARLDPRDGQALDALGFLETSRHHYDTARAALDKAVALRPDNLNYVTDRATVALGQGDLAGARAILRAAPATGDPASLVAYVATFGDLGWVLDSTQAQRLLTLRPDEFGGDRATWGLVLAQQYAFRGDHVRSRIYADSARIAFEGQLKSAPFDAQHGQRHAELAVALAYLGRETDAIREGERAVSLVPIAKDALFGPYNQHQLARVYIILGQPDKALDLLEPLLRISYWLSPGWLRIDPNFAPLRGNPRFERLVAGR
jgi:tetratricopeptide (TPR) repeat protein